MNFDEAIHAHASWEMQLTTFLKNPDDSLKAEVICRDDQCVLGKWIYGEGGRYQNLPEFQKLKEVHAALHREAATIVEQAKKGENMVADTVLGAKSKFAVYSGQVVTQIRIMRNKVGLAA